MADPAVRRTSGAVTDQSIGDLVSVAARDISQLVRYELDLAKLELKSDAKRAGIGGGTARHRGVRGLPGADAAVLRLRLRPQRARRSGGLWASFLSSPATCVLLIGVAALVAWRHGAQDDRHEQDQEQPGRRDVAAAPPQAGWPAAPAPRPKPGNHDRARQRSIYVAGPWSHRSVSANGTRFHVAESGDGPLVLLLHGFPEFWWTWRHQLSSLSQAGYRAVAPDLRGYGASDKPPRGYDLVTAASDAAGLVRSLGEANAVVIGHDWGGLIAWTMATYYPKVVRRLAVVSMPHPLRLRAAVLSAPFAQARSMGYALGFQLPMLPERRLLKDGAQRVGKLLSAWSGPGWPDPETERRYEEAMSLPSVAHSALEYHRWYLRSRFRPDGIAYTRMMRSPIQAPTLHLHGALDPCVLPSAARGSGVHVEAPYRWRLLDGAGHFPHEEVPERFDLELRSWLADPEPER